MGGLSRVPPGWRHGVRNPSELPGTLEVQTMRVSLVRCALVCLIAVCIVAEAGRAAERFTLDGEYDLSGERSSETQTFSMESRLVTYALDGSRVGTDVFRMRLRCVPSGVSGKEADEYTCLRFTLEQDGGPEVSIPVLRNWSYLLDEEGIDDRGQVFGIDHARFEGLVDSLGAAVPIGKRYHVYNAFIDYHGFCDFFARPAAEGNGIQHLKKIGDGIVHAAAFSEAPTNLGAGISEGSSFVNGEITLEFKGLSVVNGSPCALVRYDSGESSFKMILKPMPEMEVVTVGSSHYWGDIYRNLETGWVEKVTMTEVVVSETALPGPPDKVNAVIERSITILNVTEAGPGR